MVFEMSSVSEKNSISNTGKTAMNIDPETKTSIGLKPMAFNCPKERLLITAIMAKGIK